MIGYWHHSVVRPSVRLSVCLSVCLSVMLCIVTLRVGVAAKSCTSVFLAGMFLFVCSDTFAVGCIVQPQNAPQKRSEKRHKCLMDSGTRVVYARLVCQQWHTAPSRQSEARDLAKACDCSCSRGVRTADCGRRSAVIVGSADCQRTDFLFRGRDVAIAMNSVKILHAVRSAITAIAELLVLSSTCRHFWQSADKDRQRNACCGGDTARWRRKIRTDISSVIAQSSLR